jgi:hypothetical protein
MSVESTRQVMIRYLEAYDESMLVDPPQMEARWQESAGVLHQALSAGRSEQFGQNYGGWLKPWCLLQRAAFVIDCHDRIVYAEYVADQLCEPDYRVPCKRFIGLHEHDGHDEMDASPITGTRRGIPLLSGQGKRPLAAALLVGGGMENKNCRYFHHIDENNWQASTRFAHTVRLLPSNVTERKLLIGFLAQGGLRS